MKTLQNKIYEAIFPDPTNSNLETVRTETKGTFSPTGLKQAMKNTTMICTDIVTELPAIALTKRNSMTIFNRSATGSIFIGNSDVTAEIPTSFPDYTWGYELKPLAYINFDIAEDISLFGICQSGVSVLLQIMELA